MLHNSHFIVRRYSNGMRGMNRQFLSVIQPVEYIHIQMSRMNMRIVQFIQNSGIDRTMAIGRRRSFTSISEEPLKCIQLASFDDNELISR